MLRFVKDFLNGYDVKGGNELKEIQVKDLPKESKVKVKVKCDICGTEKELSLRI